MNRGQKVNPTATTLLTTAKKWLRLLGRAFSGAIQIVAVLGVLSGFYHRPMRVLAVDEAGNPVAGVILEKDKPAHSFFFISGKLLCSMPGPQIRWPLLLIVKPGKIIATPDRI